MFFATITFSARGWLWWTFGVLALALLISFWSYRTVPSGPFRWAGLGLKMLGFLGLAFCLLEPLWSGQRARPGANVFAVVADNSQGLQIKDRQSPQTRGETLLRLLDPQAHSWLGSLEENFELRRYFFDARLQATRDFSELAFDGRASALGSTLRMLADRYRSRPLAGVLLLTDGNATDLKGTPELAGLPPIYPVVIGNQDPIQDIAVQQIRVSQTAFEDAPVSIQVDASTVGYDGALVAAQLLDRSGKKVAEQTLKARKANDLLAFRFQFRPEAQGLSFYKLRVRSQAEVGSPDTLENTQEATLANNGSVLAVDRGRGPYRILYVSGRPNWEFKFLNRAVQADDQLQMTALIRVAKREPKFNFMGRAGESSNPLFRGFGNQQDVEQYDQPVLVRLNTRDEIELRGGFPTRPEDLYVLSSTLGS